MEDYENREKLLHQIMAYDFAINELALYLDTHSDDEKALCLHNRYCKECKELKDKYQKVYGPLTIEYPCNKWRWLEEPWPSFGLGYLFLGTLFKNI
ncbi:MAG: spore coat protein CotJB [Clostridia bacterium]|nr:spore coat protein CotJB [Clostridia bacterium]